jgi:hypothetical protein
VDSGNEPIIPTRGNLLIATGDASDQPSDEAFVFQARGATMPGRTLLFVGILVLAVAGPYLISQEGPLRTTPAADPSGAGASLWQNLKGPFSASSTPMPDSTGEKTLQVASLDGLPGRPVASQQLGGPAGISLADALRFEVTPSWVAQNWARVTTQLAEADYHGLRVPLVTGTEAHDLAGSLSYYFNAQNQCERITFFGYTGDFEPLAALLQSRFGMQQYASVGPGLFLSFVGPQPVGVLRIEDAAVQMVNQPRSRYRVVLELNLPRQGAMLSEEMMVKLQSLRDAKML